jgi:hypothetical protein
MLGKYKVFHDGKVLCVKSYLMNENVKSAQATTWHPLPKVL